MLIIDDDKMNTEIIEEYLEDFPSNLSFNTKVINYPFEATSEIEYVKYELIILDIRMPGINGIEILKKIKTSEMNSTASVLIQSASIMPEHKEACYQHGAYYYLTKPYNFNSFVDAVDRLLLVGGKNG